MTDIECPWCLRVARNSFPYLLRRHAFYAHANDPVRMMSCKEPGCEGTQPATVSAQAFIDHYCEHLRVRYAVGPLEDRDHEAPRSSFDEEDDVPLVQLDDWMLDAGGFASLASLFNGQPLNIFFLFI